MKKARIVCGPLIAALLFPGLAVAQFTIPNYSTATHKSQAAPDSGDFTILANAIASTGVVSGCAVTPQGSPDMTVAVASGVVQVLGVSATVTGTNVNIGAAGASPRFDLVTANASGVLSVVAGTPAAVAEFPTTSNVVLAAVYVPVGTTSIVAGNIIDKRAITGVPTGRSLVVTSAGGSNTAFGFEALQPLTAAGSGNTAIGAGALHYNTGGSNVAVGQSAIGNAVGAGSNNMALGESSLGGLTSGSNNTAAGQYSGLVSGATPAIANKLTTGSNNTFVGQQSGFGSATQRTNSTAIGANAYVDASNTVALGDGSVTEVIAGSAYQAQMSAKNFRSFAGNGGFADFNSATELITLSTGAATTDSSANLLPAGAIILGVTYLVTTTITTAVNFSIGDTTTAARFVSGATGVTAGDTGVGLLMNNPDVAAAAGPVQSAAAKVRITLNTTPGAGVIRVQVYYMTFSAPTT